MFKYILKKIIWFIPTLVLVSLCTFYLLSILPGDAATQMAQTHKNGQLQSAENFKAQKLYWQKKLGLNAPLFYFTVCKLSEPDSLFLIFDKKEFELLKSEINLQHKNSIKSVIPKLIFNGRNNQYHAWLFGNSFKKGLLQGNFGISYQKNEPVLNIILNKLNWSLLFSFLAIILAYVISIPISINNIINATKKSNKLINFIFYVLYALPEFFVGVVLLLLFSNSDMLYILPSSGIKPIDGYSSNLFLIKLKETLPYLILPLICYTYSSLAFITKLTTTNLTEQLQFNYINTARAKGLSNKSIVIKHALKNSIFPLITVFTSVFANVIGSSIIIESVFTIPGIGLETITAIQNHDYPIVIGVILFSAILTLLSYLIADILYALFDPRIKLKN